MLWILALACTATPPNVAPLWELDGDDLLDAPWPTDTRIDETGRIDVSGFPGESEIPLLGLYIGLLDDETGYGTNSPVYVPFGAPIDESLLPTGLPATTDAVFLVDIDPSSEHWGELVPLRHQFNRERTSAMPANLLASAPVWGHPLRPSTTYALVVTTQLARTAPGFASVWQPGSEHAQTYAPLKTALPFLGLATGDVAVATVFTTTDPTRRMAKHARLIQEHLTPPTLAQELRLDESATNAHYQVFEGTMKAPLWQHGDRPYAASGGDFAYDDEARPVVAAWDDLRLAVCTPKDLSSPPEGGWPVVLYRHGTGGDFRSFCSGTGEFSVARWLAESGFIGIGTDEPLHGIRATPTTNPELHWFNYFNPTAGRTNFLQSALDIVYLGEAFGSQQVTFTTDTGASVPLDPDRLYVMGHSQGGLAAAIALPWLGSRLDGAVLSGAGGGLSITIVERKDPVDIAAQVESVLGFDDGEALDEFHPVTGLIQWITESTDPINFAPYWNAEPAPWGSQQPISVLVTSGELDHATPHRSGSALAAAAELPMVLPLFDEPAAFMLHGLELVQPPVQANLTAYDGSAVTGGFLQYAGTGHFVVFERREARDSVRDFFVSAATGVAEIDRDDD